MPRREMIAARSSFGDVGRRGARLFRVGRLLAVGGLGAARDVHHVARKAKIILAGHLGIPSGWPLE
jgi:hypothetical protein